MNDLTSKEICQQLVILRHVQRVVSVQIGRLNLDIMIEASVAARRMRVLARRAS